MQKRGFHLFIAADPVDSLHSIHGCCGDLYVTLGIYLLAVGSAGLFWRFGGSGSGQFSDALSDFVLAEGGAPRISGCPSGAEAVL